MEKLQATTTWTNKVIWSEGMFLQPQHFQQLDRYHEKLIENRTRPLAGFFWGCGRGRNLILGQYQVLTGLLHEVGEKRWTTVTADLRLARIPES